MTAPRPSKKATPAKRAAPSKRGQTANGRRRTRPAPTVEAASAPAGSRTANGQAGRRPAADPGDDEIPRWVRKAIALFFAWVVGLVVAYWLVTRLRPILLVLLVALFVSLAMEPPVNALSRRGWSRSGATAFVGGLFLIVTIGFLAAF